MNGNYYPNPTFPQSDMNPQLSEEVVLSNSENTEDRNIFLNNKFDYIENIMRLNKGKKVTLLTYYPSGEQKEKEFKGVIEDIVKEYLIMSNPLNGEWYMLPIIYVNCFVFEEKINL